MLFRRSERTYMLLHAYVFVAFAFGAGLMDPVFCLAKDPNVKPKKAMDQVHIKIERAVYHKECGLLIFNVSFDNAMKKPVFLVVQGFAFLKGPQSAPCTHELTVEKTHQKLII